MSGNVLPRDAFLHDAVAAVYRFRPPYPDQIIRRLGSWASAPQDVVLDLGCGTGDISRLLAPLVGRIAAVDPSAAMLGVARDSSGGDAQNITWHLSTAEAFAYPTRCSLIVAAESIHWMNLDIVFAKARVSLALAGIFAIVGREYETAWDAELRQLIPEFSATTDFVPFDLSSLERPGRMKVEEASVTPWSVYRQSIEDYVELQHSSAGFARHRMGMERAAQFDNALRAVLELHATEGIVEYKTAASLRWGRLRL